MNVSEAGPSIDGFPLKLWPFLPVSLLVAVLVSCTTKTQSEEFEYDCVVVHASLIAYWNSQRMWPEKQTEILNAIPDDTRLDAWGRSYQFSFDRSENAYSVRSAGADGIAGTSDDLLRCYQLDQERKTLSVICTKPH